MQREPVQTYCSPAFKAITKKHRTFEKDFSQAYTLLNQQLCPKKAERPLTPKHLVRIHQSDGFEIWKFQVMVRGLRPGQWPRLWVGVASAEGILVPLALGMHGDNYRDNDMEEIAITTMKGYCAALHEN